MEPKLTAPLPTLQRTNREFLLQSRPFRTLNPPNPGTIPREAGATNTHREGSVREDIQHPVNSSRTSLVKLAAYTYCCR